MKILKNHLFYKMFFNATQEFTYITNLTNHIFWTIMGRRRRAVLWEKFRRAANISKTVG